jgi:hypothetical protein
MDWQPKKIVLFERTLPEPRWNATKYSPEPIKKKVKPQWRLKQPA